MGENSQQRATEILTELGGTGGRASAEELFRSSTTSSGISPGTGRSASGLSYSWKRNVTMAPATDR